MSLPLFALPYAIIFITFSDENMNHALLNIIRHNCWNDLIGVFAVDYKIAVGSENCAVFLDFAHSNKIGIGERHQDILVTQG